MKSIKYFICSLLGWGATITLLSCSNDTENMGMYSDSEFHNKVVQLQSQYNSSLKIDESCLRKDEETLNNISDIMRTIENSSFDYELIVSEDGGLIAMPILSTTATRSNAPELNPVIYTETLSHEVLPCDLEIYGEWEDFQIRPCDSRHRLVNVSCTGTVTKDNVYVYGDVRIRPYGDSGYTTYEIFRQKRQGTDILEVVIK